MKIIIDTYRDKVWGRNTLKKAEMVALVKESFRAVKIQPKQVFLNVSFVGVDEMIQYNYKYRGQNAVTNVLSFANKNYVQDFIKNQNNNVNIDDNTEGKYARKSDKNKISNNNNVYKIGLMQLGDMMLCYEKIEEEARQFGKTFPNRLAHLFVHSALHLIGYDHIIDREREVMESLEEQILSKFGIKDIYLKG